MTARFLVWCSASELTTLSNAAFVRTHARNARDRPPQSVGVSCAAGPATSDFASKSWSRRRWESNPLQTALQAVAVPSGSSVGSMSVSSPGIEPGLRPSQGRVRNPAHSKDRNSCRRQRPAEESNPVLQFRRLPCSSGTLARHGSSVVSGKLVNGCN